MSMMIILGYFFLFGKSRKLEEKNKIIKNIY